MPAFQASKFGRHTKCMNRFASAGERSSPFVAWSAGLPIGLAAWWASEQLAHCGSWGSALAIGCVGPVAFALCLVLTKWTNAEAWSDLRPLLKAAGGRFMRRRIAPGAAA